MSALVSKSIKCVRDLFFLAAQNEHGHYMACPFGVELTGFHCILLYIFCYFHRKAKMIRASKRTKQRILLRDSCVHDQLNTTSLVNESRMSTPSVIGAEFTS